jgi:protein-tyrosine-phosphatase
MLDSRSDPMARILLVCTGNICRSPMAEGLLRSAFERRGGDVPVVSSAGTIARDGNPATPEAVRAAAELGIDISGHSARRLRPEQIDLADLVVGMAGEHRAEILASVPDAAEKTFTLKGLVALLDEGGSEEADQDVADPLGLPLEGYRTVARELRELCERLAAGLNERNPVPTGRAD